MNAAILIAQAQKLLKEAANIIQQAGKYTSQIGQPHPYADWLDACESLLAQASRQEAAQPVSALALAAKRASADMYVACEHDWREYYTGPKVTHRICAKCEYKEPIIDTRPQFAEAAQPVAKPFAYAYRRGRREDDGKIYKDAAYLSFVDPRPFPEAPDAPVIEFYELYTHSAPAEGWQLLPKEPTPAMVEAASTLFRQEREHAAKTWVPGDTFMGPSGVGYYKAMLAAAPKEQS